jgi:hypothetical protein
MKNSLSLIIIVIALSVVGCRLIDGSSKGSQMDKLTLSINADKSIYQLGEAVRVSVILTNSGGVDILVNKRMALNFPDAPKTARDLSFTIEGPLGKLAPFIARVNVRPTRPNDFILLSPDETVEIFYDIESLYYLEDIGSYSIFAIYQNALDPDEITNAWKGELKSNVIVFEVVP